MERRKFLQSFTNLVEPSSKIEDHLYFPTITGITTGLEPYSGVWDKSKASHLIRRTLFGMKKSELTFALKAGLNGSID
ncbi:MAG: hypothetical protein NTW25_16520 [Candidatus Kapabacteria bacterium]|nr:hypothetical protein [Candidatus Kapabacteria bacterium]